MVASKLIYNIETGLCNICVNIIAYLNPIFNVTHDLKTYICFGKSA